MTVSGSGIVLCRLAAVFLFVRGVEHIGYALPMAVSPATSTWQALVSGTFAVAAPVVAAVLVWRLAPTIGSFGGDNSDPALASTSSDAKLIVIGTFLVGLYALLFGIVNAVSVEVGLWAQDALNETTRFPTDSAWLRSLPSRVPYLIQIVLGIILMLGRNGFVSVVSRARYAGRSAS